MSHEVEIKYRITTAERQRLLAYFDAAFPATGERDLYEAAPGAVTDVRNFLAEMDLLPGGAAAPAPAAPGGGLFNLETTSWAVYDRYFFDHRHLLFRARLMVDAARGEARAEITHKQADHKIGEAVNRMEINLPLSTNGVRDGDFESVLKLMGLMNFKPVLVMKKERLYEKIRFGASAPMQSLLFTLDRVSAALPDPEECDRPASKENERNWLPIGDFVEVEAMVAEARNIDFAGRVVAQWAARLDATQTWKKEKDGYFALAAQKLGTGGG